jgi:hypothetical protein
LSLLFKLAFSAGEEKSFALAVLELHQGPRTTPYHATSIRILVVSCSIL